MNIRKYVSDQSRISSITLFLFASLSLSFYESQSQQKYATSQNRTTPASDTTIKPGHLTPQERDFATGFLKETELGVSSAIKGLNQAQLTWKPAVDKWSVEDCVKHIAVSEKNIWEMVNQSLQQPANPDKRSGIKSTDEQLINAVKDRSHKSKTGETFEPANAGYKSLSDALASFQENRDKLIVYVNSTADDLRNHVSVLPFGTYDAYQIILLISAHSNRHTQQIEEVKANVNFPKL